MKGWPMGECELIWTNLADAVHVFRNRWMGLVRDSEHGEHYHPTQKPVALMRWLIERFTKTGERILDPYMGSGSTLVAAKSVDRRAIGIEIEERYCEIAAKRLAQSVMQFGRHCDETG
jgi:site-specific DNA-methyltransferase (adenine-specific)